MTTESAQCEGMCPRFEVAVQLLGKKWTGMLLRVLLFEGPQRFSDFRRHIPDLSDRLLTERLKELEQHGIVSRKVHARRPIAVEYEATKKGEALAPVIRAIQSWADSWC